MFFVYNPMTFNKGLISCNSNVVFHLSHYQIRTPKSITIPIKLSKFVSLSYVLESSLAPENLKSSRIVDKTAKRFNKSSHNTFYKTVGNKDIGNSFVNVVKGSGMSLEMESIPTIDECLNMKDLSCSLMRRVKEFTSLSNLKKVLCNEGFDVLKISYLGHTFNHIASKWGKLMEVDDYDDTNFHSKRLCILTTVSFYVVKFIGCVQNKYLGGLRNLQKRRKKMMYLLKTIMAGYIVIRRSIIVMIRVMWRRFLKQVSMFLKVVGDDNSFVHTVGCKENSGSVNKISDSMGSCRLKKSGMPRIKLMIVVVYAPQEASEKRMIWDYLTHVSDQWDGEIVLMGDFNEVSYKPERFGSNFKAHDVDIFNSLIHNAGLNEVHLGGSAFTWCHKSATKMSKLDRFLVSKNLLHSCSNINTISLDRYISDHRPILLREAIFDYGQILFRFYNYWLKVDGFDKLVRDAWNDAPGLGTRAVCSGAKEPREEEERRNVSWLTS
nr:RNA-directed DNA polymerase, eukaryota [Tanacetum cinerariifolium]